MKLEFYRQISEKYTNIKVHDNPSILSRAFPCGQAGRQADRVAFRNFANAPNSRRCGSVL